MVAAVAMMVSCTGNGNANQSGSAASGEAQKDGAAFTFKVNNGISGTTGSKNCFLVELGAPIEFEAVENGENVDLTAKVKVKHSDKNEVDPDPRDGAELWISGRDDDNKDVEKVVLKAEEESFKALQEFFGKPAGEEIELIFKGSAPKADLEKLNGKECTNTLVI